VRGCSLTESARQRDREIAREEGGGSRIGRGNDITPNQLNAKGELEGERRGQKRSRSLSTRHDSTTYTHTVANGRTARGGRRWRRQSARTPETMTAESMLCNAMQCYAMAMRRATRSTRKSGPVLRRPKCGGAHPTSLWPALCRRVTPPNTIHDRDPAAQPLPHRSNTAHSDQAHAHARLVRRPLHNRTEESARALRVCHIQNRICHRNRRRGCDRTRSTILTSRTRSVAQSRTARTAASLAGPTKRLRSRPLRSQTQTVRRHHRRSSSEEVQRWPQC
jgi:hypothetical protein